MVLIPESFTLACETEIVKSRSEGGIFNLKIFSPSSLIREVREMTGHGSGKPISGDGQNMIISQLLHHCRGELRYYGDSAAQPTLAARIAGQIDEFTRARLTPGFLRQYSPESRRTGAKLEDMALIWDGYQQILEKGFEDTVGQWMSAVSQIRRSGIIRGKQLLIYGFDYITHDILNLAEAALAPAEEGGAAEVVIGLISDDAGADRDIFRAANDSVRALGIYLDEKGGGLHPAAETAMPADGPGALPMWRRTIYAWAPSPAKDLSPEQDGTVVIREDPAAARKGRHGRSWRKPMCRTCPMCGCTTPGTPIWNASMPARR